MKLVGEAVAEEYPKYSTDSNLVVLGLYKYSYDYSFIKIVQQLNEICI